MTTFRFRENDIEDPAVVDAFKEIANILDGIAAGAVPLPGSDEDAIHDNIAAEISAVTEKVTLVDADLVLIEDSEDSDAKKKAQLVNLPTGSDADAIHDNVAAEISVITEKVTPVNADFALIEDSADSNNKKRAQLGNLPGGGGGGSPFLTPLDVHTVGNVAIGGSHDVLLRLTRLDGTLLSIFGFDADDDLWIKSMNEGKRVRFVRENSLGTEETYLQAIENGTFMRGLVSVTLGVGVVDTAIRCVEGQEVTLRYNDIEVLETTTAANGGALANNQNTGAGFERVLTISDLGGIGGVAQTLTAMWGSSSSYQQTNVSGATIIYQSGVVSRFEDNAELRFGTGDDIVIDFDATNWVVAGIGLATFTGFGGFSPGTYLQLKTATDAELNAIANAINTAAGKIQGAVVYNTDTDNPVYAVGAADGSVWVDGAGSTVNTPV